MFFLLWSALKNSFPTALSNVSFMLCLFTCLMWHIWSLLNTLGIFVTEISLS